jgi:hypothetical protein
MKATSKKKNPIGGNSIHWLRRFFPLVEKVQDADKPVIVEVTATHVANADVKSHRTCALALACKEFFHADGVVIALTTSWIIRGRTATRYRNAGTLSREITSFDRKAGFDIGFYLLTPASPSNKLGTKRAYDPVRRAKRKTEGKAFRHFTRNVRSTIGFYPKNAA